MIRRLSMLALVLATGCAVETATETTPATCAPVEAPRTTTKTACGGSVLARDRVFHAYYAEVRSPEGDVMVIFELGSREGSNTTTAYFTAGEAGPPSASMMMEDGKLWDAELEGDRARLTWFDREGADEYALACEVFP